MLAMGAGDRLEEHATPGPISLAVREGRIRFSTPDGKIEAGPETLRDLGGRLEDHIRLEERKVFPLIEGLLPEVALSEVASRLEVAESSLQPGSGVPTDGGTDRSRRP